MPRDEGNADHHDHASQAAERLAFIKDFLCAPLASIRKSVAATLSHRFQVVSTDSRRP
jgi:hypothetical protein